MHKVERYIILFGSDKVLKMKYVLGHKSPDTDAICSAIAYAQFLTDGGEEAHPIALGTANNETKFVLETWSTDMPEIVSSLSQGSAIILVDHNESGQSIDQRYNYQVVGVIDHHKVADFATNDPVMMRLMPWGSTCSVIASMFIETGYQPAQHIAGLMISAILSDTLYFRSPTSTKYDENMVIRLNTFAQIKDLEAYSMEMFSAKSDVSALSAEEIVSSDYKIFDLNGHAVGVGVHETTNTSFVLERKQEILQALSEIRTSQGLVYAVFCLVDILNERNTLFVLDDATADLIASVYGVSVQGSLADLGSRISRKKQIIPPLAAYFAAE